MMRPPPDGLCVPGWAFFTIELVNAFEQEKAQGKAGQIAKGLTKLDLPSSGKRSPGSLRDSRRPP